MIKKSLLNCGILAGAEDSIAITPDSFENHQYEPMEMIELMKALLAKLCEGTPGVNANNGIISGVLVTVGDLARVGGFAMREYIPELIPRIFEALLDEAAATKRKVAVATLGQLVPSTGYVIAPCNKYPQLPSLLLKLLNGELA
ncbi:unnamed protein product [Lactuca saligna]|uniref:Serine/threonine-protein kinase TOR n=1 Tax=Lactuca saligna TaxID=75948 RepID=A0AA36A241_LACSI|nr:unnamed protein product [Lactuca saligna]